MVPRFFKVLVVFLMIILRSDSQVRRLTRTTTARVKIKEIVKKFAFDSESLSVFHVFLSIPNKHLTALKSIPERVPFGLED